MRLRAGNRAKPPSTQYPITPGEPVPSSPGRPRDITGVRREYPGDENRGVAMSLHVAGPYPGQVS